MVSGYYLKQFKLFGATLDHECTLSPETVKNSSSLLSLGSLSIYYTNTRKSLCFFLVTLLLGGVEVGEKWEGKWDLALIRSCGLCSEQHLPLPESLSFAL